MRKMLMAFVLICGMASRAEAVSLRDLIDLSRQGLSDELLIALVEAEKSVFHLSAADVRELKSKGLSDRLLIHLLQTPTLRPAAEVKVLQADARPEASAPAPRAVVVNTVVTQVQHVEVPVYVPVPVRVDRRDRDEERKDREKAQPVYWGYGGKLRPGSWKDR
jgi:hypothetical protein